MECLTLTLRRRESAACWHFKSLCNHFEPAFAILNDGRSHGAATVRTTCSRDRSRGPLGCSGASLRGRGNTRRARLPSTAAQRRHARLLIGGVLAAALGLG